MNEIKPIQTEYNGYRFRSRLEARWAVFFDAMGIKYEYEPEGFEHYDYRYLPDFYFPDFKVYGEVKPSDEKLSEDSDKIGYMVDFNGPMANGLVLLGPIPYYDPSERSAFPSHDMLYWHKGVCVKRVRFKMRGRWGATELLEVDDLGVCDTARIPVEASVEPTYYSEELKRDYTFGDFGIEAPAYAKARQARFEFGETPVVPHGR